MRRTVLASLLVLLAALLSACSSADSSATSTSIPLASAAASASNPPAGASSSAAPSPSAASVFSAPAAPAGDAPRRPLVIWHGFAPDSREAQTLQTLLDAARQAQPEFEIAAYHIPGDQLSDRFEMVTVAGGGPDLIIAPNDNVLRQARAGLLRSIDQELAAARSAFAPNALEGMTVDGQLYGVPLSRSTIALYFNRGTVAVPPPTTQQLLDAAKAGTRVVLVRSLFHNFGLLAAFGGQLFDADGRCVADAGGVAYALSYLRELKNAGARFATDGSEAEQAFKAGEADITLNGSWLLADFQTALGEQLGVAPLPSGPTGPAKPLVSGTGFFVSANSPHTEAAFALAMQLASSDAQLLWADQAGLLPANPATPIADQAVGGLAAAALSGIARPQRPEMQAFWPAFDGALADVLENNADPVVAVQAACATVNQINGK